MLLLSAPRRARWLGRLLKGLSGFLAFLQSSSDNPLRADDYQKPGSFSGFLNLSGKGLLAFSMSQTSRYAFFASLAACFRLIPGCFSVRTRRWLRPGGSRRED